MIISDLSFLGVVSEDTKIVGGGYPYYGSPYDSFNGNFSGNYQSNRSKIDQDANTYSGYTTNSASVDQSNSISGSVG